MICTKCGNAVTNGDKFCEKCGNELVLQTPSITPEEQKKARNSLISALIFSIIAIILAFFLDQYHSWSITLIYLIVKIVGFTLATIALMKVLKSPKGTEKALRGVTLALAIVGMVACGIAMITDFNNMISYIARQY